MYQYLFDPEIHRMLINFYNICGIRVGIHAPDMTILTEYPIKSDKYENYRFCDRCRHYSQIFTDRCSECDVAAFRHIRATQKTYIYRCHMGFMEALIPIKADGEIICALVIGQVQAVSDAPSTEHLKTILTSVGVPDTAMEDLLISFRSMTAIEPARFEALAYFLEICAQSIYDNRWIRQDEKSISENFIDYISANLYNDISVSDAAAALNISPSHLSRVIARDMNTTFTEYLNTRRIEIAQLLIRTTSMTVTEIALRLCFSEPTYFMRVFRRYTGMTCSQYRRCSDTQPPAGTLSADTD